MNKIYDENKVRECVFLERLNRFVGKVILNGEEVLVHIKNTGRCKELLVRGSVGYLLKSDNEKRKYMYDLISIYKGDDLVNIDSQVPNKVVYKYIEEGNLFTDVLTLRKEVTYKNSRFDLYLERRDDKGDIEKIFIEVKGVTLFDEVTARFPDAPTTRGAKHLNELLDAYENGYKTYVFFLIQCDGIRYFKGNVEKDENFCSTLLNAYENGVKVLCYNSIVTEDDIKINEKIDFQNK
ncbi:MAG: DNA/RNA nuclease SfsA [Lachnospirales bacterium]